MLLRVDIPRHPPHRQELIPDCRYWDIPALIWGRSTSLQALCIRLMRGYPHQIILISEILAFLVILILVNHSGIEGREVRQEQDSHSNNCNGCIDVKRQVGLACLCKSGEDEAKQALRR